MPSIPGINAYGYSHLPGGSIVTKDGPPEERARSKRGVAGAVASQARDRRPRAHTRHICRQAKVGDDWTKTAGTNASYLQGHRARLEENSRQAGHRIADQGPALEVGEGSGDVDHDNPVKRG